MSLPGWLNDNEFRTYPFSDAELDRDAFEWPPDETIVDFGCILGVELTFDDVEDRVWLVSITRPDSSTLIFTFGCSATDELLVFTVPTDVEEFAAFESESDTGADVLCGPSPAWSGYLQIGRLGRLLELLPIAGTLTGDETLRIEPARIQNLGNSYIRSINLANVDRIHAGTPEGCGSSNPSEEDIVITGDLCLTGDLQLLEGYNAALRQNDLDNSITIAASVGAGAGEPCEEIPLTDAEIPPDDSELLTGGPTCRSRITAINGVGGNVIQVITTQGVFVRLDDEDSSHLIIDVDLHDMAFCSEAGP